MNSDPQDRDPLAIEGLVDEYDRCEADPFLDHLPARKSNRELDRRMQILDEIAVEKLRSEN